MTEELLQENVFYLYKHKPDLFEILQKYIDNANGQTYFNLEYDAEISPNLTYVGAEQDALIYAGNEVDISNWINDNPQLVDGEYDVIIYGLGLSYHLVKLLELNSKLKFYIIEPEIGIFLEALKVVNIDQLLEHPQIDFFYLGKEDGNFQNFVYLKNIYSTQDKINLFIPFYLSLNEDIKRFYNIEYEGVKYDALSLGFETEFGTLPYRNSIQNIYHLKHTHAMNGLHLNFQNCTALIVGAGPSLEKDIAYIKNAKEKVLIIAAGSSIQSLLHFGIEPHVIVSMDPGEANGTVFDLIDASRIPLIFTNQIYSGILNKRNGNSYHAYFTTDPITQYLFSDKALRPKLIPTPSVSGTAVQVAVYLGATTIMFAGQDLSFPNKQYYATGAKHLDTNQLLSSVQKTEYVVKNVQGKENPTNLSMKLTLENIEELIQSLDQITFINTSSLGAEITGAEFIPFSKAIEHLTAREYDFDEIKRRLEVKENRNEFDTDDLLKRIDDFDDTCDRVIEQCNTSKKIVAEIDEICRRNPNKAMNLLAKLELAFEKVTEDLVFKGIVTNWVKGWTRMYDQGVYRIKKEPSIVKKSKLLNQILVPYINVVISSIEELQKEFVKVKNRIELDQV